MTLRHTLQWPVAHPPVSGVDPPALHACTSLLEQQASRPASLGYLGDPPGYRHIERIVDGIHACDLSAEGLACSNSRQEVLRPPTSV